MHVRPVKAETDENCALSAIMLPLQQDQLFLQMIDVKLFPSLIWPVLGFLGGISLYL